MRFANRNNTTSRPKSHTLPDNLPLWAEAYLQLGDSRNADCPNRRAETTGAIQTNLTVDMVAKAARRMRRTLPLNETEFRGPGLKLALTHDDYKEGKRHGWLRIFGK